MAPASDDRPVAPRLGLRMAHRQAARRESSGRGAQLAERRRRAPTPRPGTARLGPPSLLVTGPASHSFMPVTVLDARLPRAQVFRTGFTHAPQFAGCLFSSTSCSRRRDHRCRRQILTQSREAEALSAGRDLVRVLAVGSSVLRRCHRACSCPGRSTDRRICRLHATRPALSYVASHPKLPLQSGTYSSSGVQN